MPYTTTGLRQCLEEGAREFGWKEARQRAAESRGNGGHIRRGVGKDAGLWVVGGGRPPVTVVVKLFADGSVNLNMGASDIGTGTKTVMAMVVAEDLGIPLEKIQIENADTGTIQFTTPSDGSKTVPSEAPAFRAPAFSVKQQLLAMAGTELKVSPRELDFKGGSVGVKGSPGKEIKISNLSELTQQGVAVRGHNPFFLICCLLPGGNRKLSIGPVSSLLLGGKRKGQRDSGLFSILRRRNLPFFNLGEDTLLVTFFIQAAPDNLHAFDPAVRIHNQLEDELFPGVVSAQTFLQIG